jgi:hypothetical protein
MPVTIAAVAGDERERGAGDRRDRHRDQRDRKQRDAAPPGPEERPRGALGRREEQRREEEREDQLGIELERVREPRHGGDHHPEQHHQRRPRQPGPVAHPDQEHGREHQPDDEQQSFHGRQRARPSRESRCGCTRVAVRVSCWAGATGR